MYKKTINFGDLTDPRTDPLSEFQKWWKDPQVRKYFRNAEIRLLIEITEEDVPFKKKRIKTVKRKGGRAV